ncbi:hypothetical protein GGR51DRAFT_486843 [Nemania sp. FL0031]|nr:hypothetical protein GGR51DRAFT_486843 [Nemania sp. FL0031]
MSPPNVHGFDQDKVPTKTLPMLESSGFRLSVKELATVFGIDSARFGALSTRIVVPVLEGSHEKYNATKDWYGVDGWLYIVEPTVWVPQVSHGRTRPVFEFKGEYKKESHTISETKFNASTAAALDIEAGGAYMGITASTKSTKDITFEVSKSSTVDDAVEGRGPWGEHHAVELFVYPTLKCKVVKKQRMTYRINEATSELEWSKDSAQAGWWDERYVNDGSLGPLKKLVWHPVPLYGGDAKDGLPEKGWMLAVPHNAPNGDIDVTTLLSRSAWHNYFWYDVPWETVTDGQTITLAVPNNSIAFQPAATWAVLDRRDNNDWGR